MTCKHSQMVLPLFLLFSSPLEGLEKRLFRMLKNFQNVTRTNLLSLSTVGLSALISRSMVMLCPWCLSMFPCCHAVCPLDILVLCVFANGCSFLKFSFVCFEML